MNHLDHYADHSCHKSNHVRELFDTQGNRILLPLIAGLAITAPLWWRPFRPCCYPQPYQGGYGCHVKNCINNYNYTSVGQLPYYNPTPYPPYYYQ